MKMEFRARQSNILVVFVCLFNFMNLSLTMNSNGNSLVTSEPREMAICSNISVTDCCLCSEATCDNVCPSPLKLLVLLHSNQYSCDDTVTMATPSNQTLTTVPMTTTVTTEPSDDNDTSTETNVNSGSRSGNESSERTGKNMTVCLQSCPSGFYASSTNVCEECDSACLSCNGPGRSGCTQCKFTYNETCYAECPHNTHSTDGSNCTETTDIKEPDKPEPNIGVIAGAAAGGVVVVVAVIVIICCCYRRKYGSGAALTAEKGGAQKKQTGITGILQEKEETPKQKGREMGVGGSRLNYENTAPIDKDLCNTIPRQGDVVLRYTPDPTESVKANTLKKNQQELPNRDSEYANAAMVRLARNMDVDKMSAENINEHLDLETLPVAPKVPVEPPSGETRLPQKQKVTLVKRLSSKFTKKKKKAKAADPKPVETAGQNYMDMNVSNAEDEEQETYENQSNVAMETSLNQTDEQEDYENVVINSKDQSQSAINPVFQSKNKVKLKNQSKTEKDKTGSNDQLEDYENTPAKINPNVQRRVKCDSSGPPVSNRVAEARKEKREEVEVAEQEDYEEMGGANLGSARNESSTEDDLEDYENVNIKLDSAIKNNKQTGEIRDVKLKSNNNKNVSGKVTDSATEEEDYENTGEVVKKQTATEENPYENTEFLQILKRKGKA